MDKIIYKEADYKFGKPVGYLFTDDSKSESNTYYLYKDIDREEKFTSDELKNFYLNSGTVINRVKVGDTYLNVGYISVTLILMNGDSGLFNGYFFDGQDAITILPAEAENSEG